MVYNEIVHLIIISLCPLRLPTLASLTADGAEPSKLATVHSVSFPVQVYLLQEEKHGALAFATLSSKPNYFLL